MCKAPTLYPRTPSRQILSAYTWRQMAQTSTIYNLDIALSDVDRGVYENLTLRIARHPSETIEYLLMRVFAYCLEFREGVVLTEGVTAADEPAVLVRDLTGRITAWIEVGMPGASRLHRGSKLADRTAVYTHRDVRKLLLELSAARVHRASEIPVYAFERSVVDEVAGLLDRRSELSLTRTEGVLYIELDGKTFSTSITEHRLH